MKHPLIRLLVAAAVVVSIAAGLLVLLPQDYRVMNEAQDLFGYGGAHFDDADPQQDLFHTEVDISGVRDGLTYSRFDAIRDKQAVETYHGFGCHGSCEQNAEGYRWAVRKDIGKASNCVGFSWSFVEGCAAYAFAGKVPD